MSIQKYVLGQRWISKMEQELGLGIIFNATDSEVNVLFPAAKCQRKYNLHSAPLKRVIFTEGSFIKNHLGKEYLVTSLEEKDGLVTYICDSCSIPESELYDSLVSSEPFERLLYGLVDSNSQFQMRLDTLSYQSKFFHNSAFGFKGGKIALFPHQLYVANKVSDLPKSRVLLADETGLGKTIEALIIINRLLLTRRAKKILLLLPESLIFQWFAEALRKFNIKFTIFNKEYYDSVKDIVLDDGDSNVFIHEQLFIADLDYVMQNKDISNDLKISEWDLVVVDEAHHLNFKEESYLFVKELSLISQGLILLTATPEQIGHEEHFKRLQLLDGVKYNSFKSFVKEEEEYQKIVKLVHKIMTRKVGAFKFTKFEKGILKRLEGCFSNFNLDCLDEFLSVEEQKEELVSFLGDLYGLGRVVFRNSRKNVVGFPKRKSKIIEVEDSENSVINWLVSCLKKKSSEKFLIICNSATKVKELGERLKDKINVDIALFHEELSLLQRDKNVNWCAQESGARVLISSDIGSEGKNFQFLNNLILLDLVENPEKIAQRIGRLDRIGQEKTVNIFIPIRKNRKEWFLAQWLHYGLDCFNKNIQGAYSIYEKFKISLKSVLESLDSKELNVLIEETALFTKENLAKIKKGRDFLVELNSFNQLKAKKFIESLVDFNELKEFEAYVLKLFNSFNLITEEQDKFIHKVNLDFLPSADFPLPLIRYEELIVTFLREEAIKNEFMEFLTPEHPMVMNTMELLLGSEVGNSVYAVWEGSTQEEVLLEVVYVAECAAPMNLHIFKYLPPKPVRKVVNNKLCELSNKFSADMISKNTSSASKIAIFENKTFKHKVLPDMLKATEALAKLELQELIGLARENINKDFSTEINRVQELRKRNGFISEDEEVLLKEQQSEFLEALNFARVRLDSVRLVQFIA